jgi:steroid delta-isomerase-like uncharacterized protein
MPTAFPGSVLLARRDAIVLEHMGAENAHEFERCIDAFSHARYEIIPTGEVWDGKSGVNALLIQNKTAFPDFKFVPQSIQHAEDAVFVEGRFTGTHKGNWRGLPPTGRRIDFPLIIVFAFEEDRMICERTYFDLGTVLRQLGVARDPNSLGGRLGTMLNHPLVVGRAFVRQLMGR